MGKKKNLKGIDELENIFSFFYIFIVKVKHYAKEINNKRIY